MLSPAQKGETLDVKRKKIFKFDIIISLLTSDVLRVG
jgi:hypothetical protein